MKKHIVILTILGFVCGLFAYPVRIQSWDIDRDVKVLNEKHYSIDYVNRNTGAIIVYLKQNGDQSELEALGYTPQRIAEPHLDYARELYETTKDTTDPMNAYYSYTEYITFMQNTANQFPSICQLVQYGTTGQNRPLYFMKISDNVNVAEDEPEFRYTSSIHGDEVVGYDMLIRLIQLLTGQYATNTRIANIVNNTEIWINPMYNPDGYALQQRYNSAGIDLNRNFPMPTGEQHPDGEVWGVENIAFMSHANSRHFIQSMNFHGGALVINYPWDYTYTLAPDDALLQSMSLTYSTPNGPLYNSTEFEHGITNGAAWYVITGSLQDWNYGLTDCIDITAEIGTNKWPPASQLDTFWSQNQESMLSYLEYAQKGVRGIVQSSTGTPLNATISVSGNSRVVHTDPEVGDYHRLLLGGTYSITASAQGYIPQTQQVTVPTGGTATLNFTLSPAAQTTFYGMVRDVDGTPVAQATITIGTSPVTTLTSSANGTFSIANILEGSYPMTVAATGYPLLSLSLNVSAADDHQVFLLSQPVFSDGFDNGIGNWTATSPWGVTSESGNNVLKDSPTGSYANSINKSVRLTNPIAMQNMTNPSITFRAKYALESGYDFVYVEASSNNSTWTELASFTGSQSTWQTYSYSLAAYAGQNCYLRFRISTDSGVTADGITIDDVAILASQTNVPVYGDVDGDGTIDLTDYKAVLEYSVGLDPLPALDPLPWTSSRIEAADVNNDTVVNSQDAYLIRLYTRDAAFNFSAQGGNDPTLTDPLLHLNAVNSSSLDATFEHPAELRSFEISLPVSAGLSLISGDAPGTALRAINPVTGKYAVLCDGISPAGIHLNINTSLTNIACSGKVNGLSFTQNVQVGVGSDDPLIPPMQTSLLPNYPNPFNPSTTIAYQIKEDQGRISLCIYNVKGQLVKTLIDGVQSAGTHQVVWNGTDVNGAPVSSGIYYYTLKSGEHTQTRKMMMVK